MRTKLSNTQVLLRAIVTTNYREIDQAATALSGISEAEVVSWQNPPRPEYTDQAMLFLTTINELRAAATRRDIQAVGDEYATLVSTCIHCHAYVRDARVAALPGARVFELASRSDPWRPVPGTVGPAGLQTSR